MGLHMYVWSLMHSHASSADLTPPNFMGCIRAWEGGSRGFCRYLGHDMCAQRWFDCNSHCACMLSVKYVLCVRIGNSVPIFSLPQSPHSINISQCCKLSQKLLHVCLLLVHTVHACVRWIDLLVCTEYHVHIMYMHTHTGTEKNTYVLNLFLKGFITAEFWCVPN